jgi:hypothetical protein
MQYDIHEDNGEEIYAYVSKYIFKINMMKMIIIHYPPKY